MAAVPDWILELDLNAERLLVREMDVDRFWQIRPDGTRVLVGNTRDAEALVRTWTAWTEGQEVPGVGWVHGEYVGLRYTLARMDVRLLDRWPDSTPVKEHR